MTVLEKNIIMAKFIGADVDMNKTCHFDECDFIDISYCASVDLLFHFSWDWLMPVVEKLEDIYCSSDYSEYLTKKRAELMKCLVRVNINEVFFICVDLINYYSNEK